MLRQGGDFLCLGWKGLSLSSLKIEVTCSDTIRDIMSKIEKVTGEKVREDNFSAAFLSAPDRTLLSFDHGSKCLYTPYICSPSPPKTPKPSLFLLVQSCRLLSNSQTCPDDSLCCTRLPTPLAPSGSASSISTTYRASFVARRTLRKGCLCSSAVVSRSTWIILG